MAVPLLGFAAALGCRSGAGTVAESSADYAEAVRVARTEQLLTNLVRLRYRDAPVFLSVAAITTQFQDEANATLSFAAGASLTDRPTIEYSPNASSEFQRRILRPLEVGALALVVESGWRLDRVLRLAAERLNGLRNAPTASGPTPTRAPDHARFSEALERLGRLLDRGHVEVVHEIRRRDVSDPIPRTQVSGEDLLSAARDGLAFERRGAEGEIGVVAEERVAVLCFLGPASEGDDAARLRELLRLDPGRDRFDLVAVEDVPESAAGGAATVVAVDTRSLVGVMNFLSQAVEVPRPDLARGAATVTRFPDGREFPWPRVLGGLMDVRASGARPRDAAVAVRHRGHWFSVADGDQDSKSTLSLLRTLFALQAGGATAFRPVLSLPAAR